MTLFPANTLTFRPLTTPGVSVHLPRRQILFQLCERQDVRIHLHLREESRNLSKSVSQGRFIALHFENGLIYISAHFRRSWFQ